jgi:hypothetical protein
MIRGDQDTHDRLFGRAHDPWLFHTLANGHAAKSVPNTHCQASRPGEQFCVLNTFCGHPEVPPGFGVGVSADTAVTSQAVVEFSCCHPTISVSSPPSHPQFCQEVVAYA